VTNKKIVVVIGGLLLLAVVVLVLLANSPLLETLTGSGDFSLSRMGFFGLPEEYWEVTIRQNVSQKQLEAFGGPERMAETLTKQIGESLSREHAEKMEYAVKPGEKLEEGMVITTVLRGRDPSIIGAVMFDDLGELYNLLGGPIKLTMTGEAKVGAPLHLDLLGNGSTGYTWFTTGKSEVATKKGEKTWADWKIYPGRPKIHSFDYVMDVSGNVEFTIDYIRPWETVEAVQSTVILVRQGQLVREFDLTPLQPNFGEIPPSPILEYESEHKWDQGLSNPSTYNWTTTDNDQGKAMNLIIGDQGGCGTCWAFATNGLAEAAYQVQKGSVSFNLSEQYLVSCNHFARCNQGYDALGAMQYYIQTKPIDNSEPGAVMESVSPYDTSGFNCQAVQAPRTLMLERHVVTPDYEDGSSLAYVEDLKQAMRIYGPIAVAVCASDSFIAYTGGVYDTNDCQDLDHQILLVGWDNATQSWILKNSWGMDWGENGYMRIKWGTNGVGYEPIYAVAP
jgi:predicted secreted protein